MPSQSQNNETTCIFESVGVSSILHTCSVSSCSLLCFASEVSDALLQALCIKYQANFSETQNQKACRPCLFWPYPVPLASDEWNCHYGQLHAPNAWSTVLGKVGILAKATQAACCALVAAFDKAFRSPASICPRMCQTLINKRQSHHSFS